MLQRRRLPRHHGSTLYPPANGLSRLAPWEPAHLIPIEAKPLLLKDLPTDRLESLAIDLGGDARLGRRLQTLAAKRGVAALPSHLEGVRRDLWQRVQGAVAVPHLQILERAESAADGFVKYLFQGDGPEPFEAVRIPLLHRPGDEKYVVCVSSQVGCAMGCGFCATGRLGFKRQLHTWEIVDQVVKIQAEAPHPVRGVVFMGMGEPLLNYQPVMAAASILSDPSGLAIDGKAITISTVGIAPMIRRFTAERRPYRLIMSLHSARQESGLDLLPIRRAQPLNQVFDALRDYQAATGKRLVLAWTMVAGRNLGLDEVEALAELTKGLKIMLDLIPLNDPTGRYQPPEEAEYQAFLDLLRAKVACPITRRYSGGKEVHGACGMLAGLRTRPESDPGGTVAESALG